jgi:hypothetical protein
LVAKEVIKFRKMYNLEKGKSKNVEAELKKIKQILTSRVQEWFKMAQQAQVDTQSLSSTIHGDLLSLFSETEHMTDPFNLRMSVAKLDKDLKKSARAAKGTDTKDQMNSLERIEKDFTDVLSTISTLIADQIIMLRLVRDNDRARNGAILKQLGDLIFPANEFKKLKDSTEALMNHFDDIMRNHIIESLNSLINIMREV